MNGTYDLWVVFCSFLVAVLASYVALELAARVAGSPKWAAWIWIAFGSVAMGLGIWSMHFVGMLAFHLPIALAYDVPITLLSIVPAVLSAALVLSLVRRGSVTGYRLVLASVVLGSGIAAMHYSGMAAIPVVPAIRYDPLIFTASVAIAIAVAFVALKLAFSLAGGGLRLKKFAAALVMGAAICAMHYTGMAAARFAPDSVCAVAPGAIDQQWLAGIIVFVTIAVLLGTISIILYDARHAEQRARMVDALQEANAALEERTRHAEQAERAEKENEARFRGLMEQSTDGIFVSDAEGNLLLTNSRWCELLGYDMDEVAGINARQTYLEDEREVHIKRLEQVRAGQTLRFERIVKRKDGSTFPAEISLKMLDSGILQGIFHDVTEHKQAEEVLREAHEKLAVTVAVLDQLNREMALLAELSNFLISCVTVEEACNAIPKYCETLFPEGQGALYLLRASRDHLNRYAYWGAPREENPSFEPEDCWALRRGRPHTVFDPQQDAICGHIAAHHKGEPYMCVPLVVQSDLLGLMWITLADPESSGGGTDARMNGKQQLAVTLAERIALALSNIRLRENLRQQTIRDALTGLYNRRFLEESLTREMARCKRNGSQFGVLMMDIDHFKRFNDTYGHDAGDSVLRGVAKSLQENTREGDIVCRFGGEEFLILLPDADNLGTATRAQRILETMRRLDVVHNGRTLGTITASIGLATYPQNGETVRALLQAADKALYEAKGAGRDRMVVAA